MTTGSRGASYTTDPRVKKSAKASIALAFFIHTTGSRGASYTTDPRVKKSAKASIALAFSFTGGKPKFAARSTRPVLVPTTRTPSRPLVVIHNSRPHPPRADGEQDSGNTPASTPPSSPPPHERKKKLLRRVCVSMSPVIRRLSPGAWAGESWHSPGTMRRPESHSFGTGS